MKKRAQLLLFLGFILLVGCQKEATLSDKQPSPVEGSSFDSPTEAHYQKQFLQVNNAHQSIIGYKAGLTSKAGQSKFNVNEPIAGVLFEKGLSHHREVYLLNQHSRLMLETEIGFILSKPVHQEVSLDDVHRYVKSVVPVIELPDLNYPQLDKLTGLELIATNVASNKVLIGHPKALSDININTIETHLTKNGITINKGAATDALGDQLIALQWLINRLIKTGYQPQAGELLITGALGKMVAAEPGQYDADFGELGTLAFSIR